MFDGAGLFLKALSLRSAALPALIRPHFGNRMTKRNKPVRMTRILDSAPELYMTALNQTAALPLGGRVKVDPWDGHIELMKNTQVVLLSPRGRPLDAGLARRLAGTPRLIVLCGRYEGVDERVAERLADEEVSLADVVLTGGEIPAMALVDAVARFVPGVLGNALSAERDSFENGLLDHAHYTRPARYRGLEVPSVLLGGDHAAVERWGALGAREATRTRRPDLWTPFDTNAPAGRARG